MNIDELRAEIDLVDDELLSLFERRMEIAKAIGEYKKARGLPIKNSARESEILCRLAGRTRPELAEYAKALFSALFEISSGYQAAEDVS